MPAPKQKEKVRILVLEDNPRDRSLIESLLETDGLLPEFRHVQTRDEFQAALNEGHFDLIISDYSLPSMAGWSALALQQSQAPEVPFVLFSGSLGEETAVESLKKGATDYVVKQRPQRLLNAVERALQEARERREHLAAEKKIYEQAALLDLSKDAIFTCDMDEHILFWNKSAERMYGWTVTEALGQKTTVIFSADSPTELAAASRTTLEKGNWGGELQRTTKEGKPLVVESHWTLVRDGTGQPTAKLIIDTDITEKKSLEAQFLRTQRMESIGTLTSGVAHDLNNILAPILMSAPMLRWGLKPEEFEKALVTIETSAQRGANLVKQLLTFGRGVEGQRVSVQPKHLIKELVKMAQEIFPKNITLRSKCPHDLWTLRGDPTQLHQVLLNL